MAAGVARPRYYHAIAFNRDPNDPDTAPVWSDQTEKVTGIGDISRGRQYELAQSMASEPTVTFRDPDEDLNSANPSSPYVGDIRPYREMLSLAEWNATSWAASKTNDPAGNLLNSGTWQQPYDTSFESYPIGSGVVPWLSGSEGGPADGDIAVSSGAAWQGSQKCNWTTSAVGTNPYGVQWQVPCIPGVEYTSSAYVRQDAVNTLLLSVFDLGISGTSTTTTGAYVRLTVTFTATQPLHVIQMATTGVRASGITRLDGVQHEEAAAATAWTIAGPVIYPIMRPYIERFPRLWTSAGYEGWCLAPTVDALAALAGIELLPEYDAALAATEPVYSWPLSEGADASAFLAGSQSAAQVNLYPHESKYGAGEEINPGSSMVIPGDQGMTGVRFTPVSGWGGSSAEAPGTKLAAGTITLSGPKPPIAFPSAYGASWAASLSCWFAQTVDAADGGTIAAARRFTGTDRAWVPIALQAGVTSVSAILQPSMGLTPIISTETFPNDGLPHHLVATVIQDATDTTVEVFLDGASGGAVTAATSTVGGLWDLASRQATSMVVGGSLNALTVDGIVARVALWERELSGVEITALYEAGALGFAGETPGARVVRHLASGGYYGASDIDTVSSTTMQAPSHPGSIALLTDVQNNAVAEDGVVWPDPAGVIKFEGRALRWARLDPSYVFGEDEAGGEIPYLGNIEMDEDPTFVYANVRITRPGGATAIGGTQADIAIARMRYFPLKYAADVDVQDDVQAQDHADYTFNAHKEPALRIAAIELDPASNPALWPLVLGIDVGQRVRVIRRATAANAGAGLTVERDFFVENVTHSRISMDTNEWRTTLLLSPVGVPGTVPSFQPWILEDAVYGVLDSTTMLGF
jgi:hypothetical protein